MAWHPGSDVLGAEVALERAGGASIDARIGAGEDVRATVCTRGVTDGRTKAAADRWLVLGRGVCRKTIVAGRHAVVVPLRAPLGAERRVQVAVQLEAESNRERRTLVVKEAVLKP